MFLKFLDGLAYRKKAGWWDPVEGAVFINEQVVDGVDGGLVRQLNGLLSQWFWRCR